MARPRSFDQHEVVERAKRVFWEKGYRHTAIGDLERATGLNRSSLYAAFGSKEELFGQALDAYVGSFISDLLQPMESAGATVSDVEGFFRGLAARFRADGDASRGCLMVNSIAELEGRADFLGDRGRAFRERLHTAFSNALASSHDPAAVDDRARLLAAATLGVWLTARSAPADAAGACDAVVAQITAGPQPR